ncbi:hypothetical protein ACIQAL_21705 [Pseudomonas sp. NPDC088368]|uniref:hypothetical protein n=1 Tax=Pseudomonas sp. NPDC088368 TaxID=3364453 RepID=UPI0038279D80
MSFETIAVVKEGHTAEEANQLLEQGWRLLGFVESTKDGGVTYVLGKPKTRATLPENHSEPR